jgi:predicted ATP-grasp superfamily ATP-dependent carboligase
MQNTTRFKIWVCEYISAGGLASETLPASLLQEGLLMRDALLADLAALGVDCITSHDYRVMPPMHAQSVAIGPLDVANSIWQQKIAQSAVDACWVIAPETGGVLHDLCQQVQALGLPWIGCSAQAIEDTSSKARMAERCRAAGVAVLPHVMLAEVKDFEGLPWEDQANQHGWVVKPEDGAGCEATFYFKNKSELIEFNHNLKNNSLLKSSRYLLQPYVPGAALSMSVIATNTAVKVIAANRQQVEIINGEFIFSGAGVNEAAGQLNAMQRLAEQVQRAIPGLVGYWGADMILNETGDLVLVEVNPRLTTPYIALSQVLSQNPAAMILEAVLNNKLPDCIAESTVRLSLNSHQEGEYDQV